MAKATQTRITRDDLERTFRSFQDGVQGKVDEQRSTLMTAGSGIAVLLVIIVFLLGRRSGRKKTTFVEIRRV